MKPNQNLLRQKKRFPYPPLRPPVLSPTKNDQLPITTMHTACNHHLLSSSFILQIPNKFTKHHSVTVFTSPTTNGNILNPILGCSKKSSMDGPKKTTRKNPRRSSYGSSRKSVLRKTFKQEQVTFTAPISEDPVVAIIGGGMSGLLCALQLEKRGVRSTVFDTVCEILSIFYIVYLFYAIFCRTCET